MGSAVPPPPTIRLHEPARPVPPPPARSGPRVGVVIGSGAAQCAASVGVLRVLEREGVPVHVVVGCSGGSIYAALHALGVGPDEAADLTERFWDHRVMARRDRRALLSAVMPKAFRFSRDFGLVHDGPLGDALRPAFGGRTFSETTTPLRIAATDVQTGARVVLDGGSVFDAIRASVAVPFVWKPWRVDGRLLCDGCLSDPLPVDVAVDAGADVVIAIGFDAVRPRRITTAMRFTFNVTGVYTNSLLRASFERHCLGTTAAIVPVFPTFDRPVGLAGAKRLREVIARGEHAAEAALPDLHRQLAACSVAAAA